MKIPLFLPNITKEDIDSVSMALESKWLSQGKYLEEFEKEIAKKCNRKFAIAVNSGTSALHLALLALGIGPGDEVITTPYTFIATINAILHVGAIPVFVDISSENYNMDYKLIEEVISEKTKCLLPVDLYGNLENIEKIEEIAKKYNLLMLEDSCEALGAQYAGRKAGSFGDCSVLGFFPNKQITTGEGGVILTDDEKIYKCVRSLRNNGRSMYEADIEFIGYNYKMSELNAALGCSQIKRLDDFLKKRYEIYSKYNELFKDNKYIITPIFNKCLVNDQISVFSYVICLSDNFTLEDRDGIIKLMLEEGIQCGKSFPAIHLLNHIKTKSKYIRGNFPRCESIVNRTISLPFYIDISESEILTVASKLQESIKKVVH